jgi:hypothetical protein
MPLTSKGEKVLAHFKKQYGAERGEKYFYASRNKGTITGVDSSDQAPGDLGKSPPKVEAKKPDESTASQTVVETATPPQNNLGLPPQTPGQAIPINDTIRKMNITNRDFWSRQPKGR